MKMYPHELRHGYATHCLQNGVNPRAIQQATGHASSESTMGYLHAESLSVRNPLETVLGNNHLPVEVVNFAVDSKQQATAHAPRPAKSAFCTFA